MARRLLGGAISRQTGVRIGSDILRRERFGQLDQRALAREQVLRIAAVSVDSGKRAIERVHVVTTTAGQAMSARHQWMTNDAIANLDAFDAGPDCLHPSGVLVSHDVGELDINLAA